MMTLPAGKTNEALLDTHRDLATDNSGFTLVELCLVGAILAVILALAWPVLSQTARRTQLSLAGDELAATFNLARDSALNESKYYCVQFDAPDSSYWIGTRKTDSDDFIRAEGSLYGKHAWPEDIRAENMSGSRVIFYPDGTSQDFEISFKNSRGVISVIRLNGSSGRIKIEERDK
jgi:Tfp pilus assembly protein FimT